MVNKVNKEFVSQLCVKVGSLAKDKGIEMPKFNEKNQQSLLEGIFEFLVKCIDAPTSKPAPCSASCVEGRKPGNEREDEFEEGEIRSPSSPSPQSETLTVSPDVEIVGPKARKEIHRLNQRILRLEDNMDLVMQRSRKGGIIISSPNFKDPASQVVTKPTLFGFKCEEESENLPKVIALLNERYNTKIRCEDVFAGHFINENSYYIKFANRNPVTSPWAIFIKEMRRGGPGGNKELNIHATFDLTKVRLALCSACRRLKKENKITRYSTNENGEIAIEIRGKWQKITSHFSSEGNYHPTLTADELSNLF